VRLVVVVVALFSLGAGSVQGSTPRDHLRIVVWPQGTGSPPRTARTLTCGPAGGTLPGAAKACEKLAALARPFAPVPAGVMCSQIVSGPKVALVTGTYGGRRIWARFRRTDSCQTERWSRVAFIFLTG
jgi:Subtilisin inhibitor-like